MIRLIVWVTMPSGNQVKAGELVVADPDFRGALQGMFRYSPAYLDNSDAFSLDPICLPLSTEKFSADRPHSGVHGVFEDSLPDDWGRELMARRYNLSREDQRVPNFLRLLGGDGLGALSYCESDPIKHQPVGVVISNLGELLALAERFEQDVPVVEDELALLFQAGSSPGGARPKVLVDDVQGSFIAKFSSVKDKLDVVALEKATMELANSAGINCAQTKVHKLGTKKILLVRRFDCTEGGGRNHLISMQTLLRADGYYNASYSDLADVIKRVSIRPSSDLETLFKQMIFNAMIGNTDDHLKNFCMLHNDEGWCLSPAYDLLPNVNSNREHVLRIGLNHTPPSYKELVSQGKCFNIKRKEKAKKIIHNIFSVVSKWPAVFKEHEVPESDSQIIGRDIESRLAKMVDEEGKQEN